MVSQHSAESHDRHREEDIEHLLTQMTISEKASLLAGASMWETPAIARLGIPAFRVSDGPNGARGSQGFAGSDVTSAAFPVGIALAATWDPDRIAEIGAALAEEAQNKGARLLLGPTVNIHRSPLNGRNFECFSEDPYLSARIAVGYIRGLQSEGVGATVKHFVLNDSEFERNTISVEADERTLREIYLPPFYAAVREAGTWALMSSYNRIDGVYAGENPAILRDILKEEWRFDGLVMSDWFGTHSTVAAINVGLDLEMPGPPRWRGEKLVAAVDSGEVSEATLDDATRRLLRTMMRTGTFDQRADQQGDLPETAPERGVDRPAVRQLIRRTGAESIVLLKNDHHLLPLNAASLKKIAVIGPNAKAAQIMGGGSAQVNAHYAISPWGALQDRLGERVELAFEQGTTNHKRLPAVPTALLRGGGYTLSFYDNTDLHGAVVHTSTSLSSEQIWFGPPAPGINRPEFSVRMTATFTPTESGLHSFSLTSAGLSRLSINDSLLIDNWDGWESGDYIFGLGSSERRQSINLEADRGYDLTVDYSQQGLSPLRAVRIGYLPPVDPEAIPRAASLAAAADVALVFVGLTGEWDSEGQDRPGLELPGAQDELVTAIAAVNPRTIVVLQSGGPVAIPWLPDVGALIEAWYPGQECGNAIADVLFGDVNPSGKLPQTFPVRLQDNPAFLNYPGENGHVHYGERMFVGYRWYDARLTAPLFPFGFGLSYTTYVYGEVQLGVEEIAPGQTLTAEIEITNAGDVEGKEIVQLYIHDRMSRLSRPEKELKGFQKVELESGETKRVTFTIDRSALAYWDDRDHLWIAEAGKFDVLIGRSASKIESQATFTLSKSETFIHP